MAAGVAEALVSHGVSPAEAQALAAALPRKWERLGDVALLPEASRKHQVLQALLHAHSGAAGERRTAELCAPACANDGACVSAPEPMSSREASDGWLPLAAAEAAAAACAGVLGARRLGVQAAIEPSLHRKSRVRIIWPPGVHDGCVRHVENGVTYAFDLTRNMFASGNGTERMRVGRLGRPGETVVDLYAGIGYFTLPYLLKARVDRVHACEWDEDALEALRAGAEANGVVERCIVHPGDNVSSLSAFEGQAHRVNLGLIPSSEAGWPVAVRALRAEGGWLHVHANVPTTIEPRALWLAHLSDSLAAIAQDAGRQSWAPPVVVHVERVKGYAPRIDHCVADVWLGPEGTLPDTQKVAGGQGRVATDR
jgi:tRNA G37 N-methylase Trm5